MSAERRGRAQVAGEAATTTVTLNGRAFKVSTYVDPHPGLAGSDRIEWTEDCGRCGGTGVYTWWNSMGRCQGTCFGCCGAGRVERSSAVSTLRRSAKLDALFREHGEQLAAEVAAKRAEIEAAERAAEFARAWDDAHAEQARRAALNNEPAGEVGERLRDLDAVVEVSTHFERPSFSGYGTEMVKIVVFKLPTGQVLKAQGSASALYGLDRGDQVKVSGTVKGFSEYQGQMQTLIQRPKVERTTP